MVQPFCFLQRFSRGAIGFAPWYEFHFLLLDVLISPADKANIKEVFQIGYVEKVLPTEKPRNDPYFVPIPHSEITPG